jgi:hypothetical protein
MRTRHALSLIATAVTALVIGGGTAGTVLASQEAHAATVPAATSVSHGGGIHLDRYLPCIPSATKQCP